MRRKRLVILRTTDCIVERSVKVVLIIFFFIPWGEARSPSANQENSGLRLLGAGWMWESVGPFCRGPNSLQYATLFPATEVQEVRTLKGAGFLQVWGIVTERARRKGIKELEESTTYTLCFCLMKVKCRGRHTLR